MKRILLVWAALLGLLTAAPAVIQQTIVGDAAYSIAITDTNLVTSAPFTAGRTWTLPSAGGTNVNALQIFDTNAAISQTKQLTIAPQSGETINGNAANLILSAAGARVTMFPTTGSNWQASVYGDFQTTGICPPPATTATVTITIAAPAVITWTGHGITGACPVVFTTSSSLPTGITASTVYYVVPSSVTTNTFSIATTVANALAGTTITTSGSQAGTQTGTAGATLATATAKSITGLSLSQGDWDCRATISRTLGASTSVTVLSGSISTTNDTLSTQGGSDTINTQTAANVVGASGQDTPIGDTRLSLAATTNVFLVAKDTFTVSTNIGYGNLGCRRMR